MEQNIEKAKKSLEKERTRLLMQLDDLEHVIECSLKNYDFMIDFAIKKGFKRVVDIGCARGYQSELCNNRIDYVGINEYELDFYGQNYNRNVKYEVERYPFAKRTYSIYRDDLAISNLAIGWEYCGNKEEFKKQFSALSKNFKASLLYMPSERLSLLKKYFNHIEIIKSNDNKILSTSFYYCYNY